MTQGKRRVAERQEQKLDDPGGEALAAGNDGMAQFGGHKLSLGKSIERTRSISGKLSTPRISVGNMPHNSWR